MTGTDWFQTGSREPGWGRNSDRWTEEARMEGGVGAYCPEWSDSERMAVMFAPLRSKELNPESWNSKTAFWSQLILRLNIPCC